MFDLHLLPLLPLFCLFPLCVLYGSIHDTKSVVIVCNSAFCLRDEINVGSFLYLHCFSFSSYL